MNSEDWNSDTWTQFHCRLSRQGINPDFTTPTSQPRAAGEHFFRKSESYWLCTNSSCNEEVACYKTFDS